MRSWVNEKVGDGKMGGWRDKWMKIWVDEKKIGWVVKKMGERMDGKNIG